ncbi:MAG: hypothetical protein ABSC61_03995 [Anaerolineales bacterium]
MNARHRKAILLLGFPFLFYACQPSPISVTGTAAVPGFIRRLSETGCTRDGTIGESSVPNPAHGFPIKFQYYLPPCYDQLALHSFPTVYFILADFETGLSETDNMPISLANRLIRADKIPPAIFVVPEPVLGVGFHVSLAEDLVPHVDDLFRTIRNRRFREVSGYSHTAAIAARMAFQYPGLIGGVGIFSGGIDPSEIPQFETWVGETPKESWPRVLFDIGDKDQIIMLTRNLTGVLDRHHVPYDFHLAAGSHGDNFSVQMESYLLWFAAPW